MFNSTWMWQCGLRHARYEHAANNVEQTQSDLLLEILDRNADSEYGRMHRFSSIRRLASFMIKSRVSNTNHWRESIDSESLLDRQGVLTREAVLMFEPTSGTSGRGKIDSLHAQLETPIPTSDLGMGYGTPCRNVPILRRGSSYWSLSPAFGTQRTTSGGLAVGFDDDDRNIFRFRNVGVVMHIGRQSGCRDVSQTSTIFATRPFCNCFGSSNLTMISVWSPTFLTALLEKLDDWWHMI